MLWGIKWPLSYCGDIVKVNMEFNKDYWEKRYHENQTGWDIGYPSTPLVEYLNSITDKKSNILIPGAGNAYEAEYLFKNGFENVIVLDIAEAPLKNLKLRCPLFPEKNLIMEDFFSHNGAYDFIIEQTFFCALNPKLRSAYAKKMGELLKQNGKLIGLLFDDPLKPEGPPFGGSEEEYRKVFSEYLIIQSMQKAENSIKPRMGRELFFVAEKR